MNDDMALVREFAASRSETAFAGLVERHAGLVHSAALRQTGDPHLAREIAQAVFIVLARKAGSLGARTILSAWLYQTTRYAAADALKIRRRRQAREQEAYMQSTHNQPPDADPEPDAWRQLAPLLDDALADLGETDRTALMLRYFENKNAREIAGALRLGEAAAQKRVTRALEKLRACFAKRGVVLTATVIAGALAANAVQAAPAGLVLALKTACLATASAGTFTFLKFMSMTPIKLSLATLAVVGATTALVVQHQTQNKLRQENDVLRQQMTQIQADNGTLSNRLAATASDTSPNVEHLELLKLRGEVDLLHGQTGELARLRAENQRLAAVTPPVEPVAETPAEQQKALGILQMDQARRGVLSLIMFADDNQQQYPATLSLAAAYSKNDQGQAVASFEQIATNFDLVYQGSITNITNAPATIVLAGKQAWQGVNGNWLKAYGFADGHAEVHSTPDGNFDLWESQHMVLPAGN